MSEAKMPDVESKSTFASGGQPPGPGRLEPRMEKELGEIRKEVVESRNLVIKTDNLLKNLHAELKQVAVRQQEIARRGWIGSFVAYVIIAALCAGGAQMVMSAGSKSLHDELASITHQVDDLRAAQAKTERDANDRQQALDRAVRAYSAIAEGTPEARLHGVEALATLDRSRLSPLESRALDDRARQLKVELSASSLEEGRNAFHRQDYPVAATQLARFAALASPDSPDLLLVDQMLGHSYHELKQYADAIPPLERFVANGRGQKGLDYAMYMLGQSYEMTGQHAKAVDMLTRGITEHPASEFIGPMRSVLSQAHLALAPKIPAPPGAPPPEKKAVAPAPGPAAAKPVEPAHEGAPKAAAPAPKPAAAAKPAAESSPPPPP